ncbi:MAG: cobalamin-binding protein [Hylemonella sp.]|nr:cobalamin-binding protein [Hylemonella sp.]
MSWHRPALALLLALAAGTLRAEPVSVQDDGGRSITLSGPALRIVALAPHLTDLLLAIGAADLLVGVSRHSAPDPARWPVVGDAHSLNLEAIAALRPDLVLAWQSGTPQRQRDALRQLGLPVYESEIRSVEAMARSLRRLGTLTGRTARADTAATQLLQDWQALQARYQGARPVRVFYQVWDAPLMTFNGQHLVSQAMRACGGVGGFDALRPLTPTVSREAVLAYQPQLLLTGHGMASLDAWRAWSQLDAVRLGQLVQVNGDALTRMSPAFVPAAAELCAAIDAARRQLPAR